LGFHALKAFETAFTKARKLLFEPFDLWTWIKLIFIFILAGALGTGTNSTPTSSYNIGDKGSSSGMDTSWISQLFNSMNDTTIILLILAAILIILAIVLFFMYLVGVFNFVLVRALTTGDVKVIRPAADNWLNGLKVFLFELVITLLSIIIILIPLLIFLALIFAVVGISNSSAIAAVALIILLVALIPIIAFIVLVAMIAGIIRGFTYDFVVPIMMFKGKGLVDAWSDLFNTIMKNPVEFIVYAVARFIAQILVYLALAIILIPFLLILVGFLFLMAWLGIVLSSVLGGMLTILIIIFAALVIGLFLGLLLCVLMPIAAYFKYYVLDFLKGLDPNAVIYSEKFNA
jgi:hypothetical protein